MGLTRLLGRVGHFGSRGVAIMDIGHRDFPDEGEEAPQLQDVH